MKEVKLRKEKKERKGNSRKSQEKEKNLEERRWEAVAEVDGDCGLESLGRL